VTLNEGKERWVLAPLLSIVIDQDSPDLVLNDFMAVGFKFSSVAGVGRQARPPETRVCCGSPRMDRRSGMDLAMGNWQEPWRCALAKTGRILYSKGWRVSAGVSMAHNSYLPREVTPFSMSSFRRERSAMHSFTSGVCLKVRRKMSGSAKAGTTAERH